MFCMHGLVENQGNRRVPAQLRLLAPAQLRVSVAHIRGTERKATKTALRLPKSRKESKYTYTQRKQMPHLGYHPQPVLCRMDGSLNDPHLPPHFPSPLGSFLSW